MKEFLSILTGPLTIFWVLFIISGILYLVGRRKATRWLFCFSVIWLILISTKFLPDLLIRNLEEKYNTCSLVPAIHSGDTMMIVILGGGFSDDRRLSNNDKLSSNTLGRLVEGIRIYRMIKKDVDNERLRDEEAGAHRSPQTAVRLIVSGYAGRLEISQAAVMRAAAISLGVDSIDVEMMPETRNTSDEARTFSLLYGKKKSTILVTDAVHMPRAVRLFIKQGIKPIPAPTNHMFKINSRGSVLSWLPYSGNITKMEIAMHEYLGLLWIWLGGRQGARV